MMKALFTAATGMKGQQLTVDVISNNIANVNTNGFKRSRAEFQDLLYQTVVAPGASSSSTTRYSSGIQLGLGAKPAAVKKVFTQGDMKRTENPLDLTIQGGGFFKVLRPDGTVVYSRDGAFAADRDGQLGSALGYPMDPPITIPPDTLSIDVGPDGIVSVVQADGTTTELGQVELSSFINPAGLRSIGGNLFERTEASGDPVDGTPGIDGLGTLAQGFIEVSNVSIVTELVDMIAAQRAYELNSRAIQAADEMMQQVNGLVR
jgi:flagellar basal-body rod protein FlgG